MEAWCKDCIIFYYYFFLEEIMNFRNNASQIICILKNFCPPKSCGPTNMQKPKTGSNLNLFILVGKETFLIFV